MEYSYSAKVIRVVDGDTVYFEVSKEFEMLVDFGFHIIEKVHSHKSATMSFRLAGINAPEVVGESKAAGLAAKAELERLLSLGPIVVRTEKSDKYGRYLAYVNIVTDDGSLIDVNQAMVDGGFAVPYMVNG